MQFDPPLIRGVLVKRYKRFLADVALENGEVVTAHCANPGSMMGLQAPGSDVWLSPADKPGRKLKYTLELVAVGSGPESLVGVNTGHPNALAAAAVAAGRIPELAGYDSLRREVKYGRNSRIDLLLEGGAGPICYVEVKSVTLRRDAAGGGKGIAEFPDAVTARGAKHLEELGDVAETGGRAVMFYLVQRQDCDAFAVASDIDPAYARALERARSRGVEALCYCCKLSPTGIELDRPLPLRL